MIRILIFLLVVFALGMGFAWLADRPGDIVATFGGYQYQVSLMVAAVAVTAVVAAVMLLGGSPSRSGTAPIPLPAISGSAGATAAIRRCRPA